MIEYKTNAVTTELNETFLKSLTREERETMLDYTSGIVFLQNLISPNRKYARDLERWDNPNTDEVDENNLLIRALDPKGKIRVDLTNPHILEDIDYFREAAIHFENHGVYTHHKYNPNPYGDYIKFWNQQIIRCWEGMVRESDGEWITGYHYFYLNFSPIRKSIKTNNAKSKKVNRSVGLPDFYDGDYWFFHYVERARENGKHCGGLKKRGAGYSLKGAAMLGRNFILGESREVSSEVVSLAIANEKEYLTKDGILNKFVDVLNHNGKTTAFPNRRELKDSWQSMHWQLAEDFYEICRRLLIYYNAVGNYENNIKGLFGYFNNTSSLHLLCDTPSYLRDIEEQKQNLFGNRAKGSRATPGVNAEGLRLQKSWMLSKLEYIDDQDEEIKTIKLRRIKSLGYLEELYEFNADGNFDRVSAMGMVMILRQDRFKLTQSMSGENALPYVEEDSFIRDNYDIKIDFDKYSELLNENKKEIKYEI